MQKKSFIKNLLSLKSTGVCILILAILAKIILQFSYFSITGDKGYQLLAAKNLLGGQGLTINQISFDLLSVDNYAPLIGWPPGYSLLIAPFILLFQDDYILAALVFDILCVFPFFYYLIKLLNILLLEKWLKNLFILMAGFFIYPSHSNTSTDLPSFICMMAGFYYLLSFMQSDKKSRNKIILIGISFFGAGLLRYGYIPVVVCCPILLGFLGYFNKNKRWLTGSFILFIIVGVLISFILLFQSLYTGSATYVNTREAGFFPENLLSMYPVVPSSIIDIQPMLTGFTNLTGSNYVRNAQAYGVLGYILFFLLLTTGAYYLIRKKLIVKSIADSFFFIGTGISLLIISLLIYLSLRNSAFQSLIFSPWTYMQEFRYFVFVVLVIQLTIFVFLFNRYKDLSNFWKKIAIISAILFLTGIIHKMYFITKKATVLTSSYNFSRKQIKKKFPLLSIIDDVKILYPGHEIIIASPNYNPCNIAMLENNRALYFSSPDHFTQLITSTKPSKILVVIPTNLIPYYQTTIAGPTFRLYREEFGFAFYIFDVANYSTSTNAAQ